VDIRDEGERLPFFFTVVIKRGVTRHWGPFPDFDRAADNAEAHLSFRRLVPGTDEHGYFCVVCEGSNFSSVVADLTYPHQDPDGEEKVADYGCADCGEMTTYVVRGLGPISMERLRRLDLMRAFHEPIPSPSWWQRWKARVNK
jgi:hypothetical protein